MPFPEKVEIESKAIPEAITVKQEILKDYFRCKNICMIYRDQISVLNSIDNSSPFKDDEKNKLIRIKGKFEASISGLYVSLIPFGFTDSEIEQLRYLHNSLSDNTSLKWEYLIECFFSLGKIIKRLGISDFPIDQIPISKSWMEGLE